MPEWRAPPPLVLVADRWEQVRCPQNKRLFDVNHARLQVRYWCERCRAIHTVDVGVSCAP